jgi:hypothetical protein
MFEDSDTERLKAGSQQLLRAPGVIGGGKRKDDQFPVMKSYAHPPLCHWTSCNQHILERRKRPNLYLYNNEIFSDPTVIRL